jgi:hypothetical protein
MQSALVLTVALVGFCATAAATPLIQETLLFPDALDRTPAPQADFTILLATPDDDTSPEQTHFADPAVTFDYSLDGIPAPADVQLSGSVKIPEPPPIGLMALGLAVLGAFGIYRLNYTQQRHRRRRTMRPLTALR